MEQTNQSTISKEENLFADALTANDSKDQQEGAEQTEDLSFDVADEKAVETPAKPASEKLKITYMGKEEEIDLSDTETVKTLLQKGKNYDTVLADREALKNSDEMKFLRKLADDAGVKDIKTFMETVQKDLRNQRIQSRAQELMDEGMAEEHALHTADLELKLTESKPQPEVKPEVEDKPDASPFVELLTEYPEVAQYKTLDEFPEAVRNAIKAGKSPLVAYQAFQNAKLKEELEAVKNREGAKQRDLGSMRSAKSDEAQDAFLTGLMK